MAIQLREASGYSLRYLLTAADAGAQNLTQTTMLADAAAGPLKAKLNTGSGVWVGLDFDEDVSVNVSPHGSTPALVGYQWVIAGPDRVLQLVAAAAGDAMIEVRFNHSIEK